MAKIRTIFAEATKRGGHGVPSLITTGVGKTDAHVCCMDEISLETWTNWEITGKQLYSNIAGFSGLDKDAAPYILTLSSRITCDILILYPLMNAWRVSRGLAALTSSDYSAIPEVLTFPLLLEPGESAVWRRARLVWLHDPPSEHT